MYFCDNCKTFFDKTETQYETHGFDDGTFEEYEVCPGCKKNDFHRVTRCKECGVLMLVKDDFYGEPIEICDYCLRKGIHNIEDGNLKEDPAQSTPLDGREN